MQAARSENQVERPVGGEREQVGGNEFDRDVVVPRPRIRHGDSLRESVDTDNVHAFFRQPQRKHAGAAADIEGAAGTVAGRHYFLKQRTGLVAVPRQAFRIALGFAVKLAHYGFGDCTHGARLPSLEAVSKGVEWPVSM